MGDYLPKWKRYTKGYCRVCEKEHNYPLHVPVVDVRPIVHCDKLPGKCCHWCHQREKAGKRGLQAVGTPDTIYATCCLKLEILEMRKDVDRSRSGQPRNIKGEITWEKVRKIRELYGKPTGKVYKNGSEYRHTYKSLGAHMGLSAYLVTEIVENLVWKE